MRIIDCHLDYNYRIQCVYKFTSKFRNSNIIQKQNYTITVIFKPVGYCTIHMQICMLDNLKYIDYIFHVLNKHTVDRYCNFARHRCDNALDEAIFIHETSLFLQKVDCDILTKIGVQGFGI